MAEGAAADLVKGAGAVVWRPGEQGLEVVLVHRPRYDDWSFPKGKCHRGEHVLSAAIREVAEETGVRVVLGRPLPPSVYSVTAGVKRVNYWVAQYAGAAEFMPGDEVDEMRWLPVHAARERLSYARDRLLLDEFGSGPAATVPLILLRHAEAGRKPALAGEEAAAADLARPLDEAGLADAAALAGVLGAYGRCRVISSPAERCVATVRPYAEAVGVPVEVEPALAAVADPAMQAELLSAATGSTRAGHPRPPATLGELGARRIASLAANGTPAVVCAHRENLPVLIAAACGALDASPPDAGELDKSEFWVLQSAQGKLASAERHGLAPC